MRKLARYIGQAALLGGMVWLGRGIVAGGMLHTLADASLPKLFAAFAAAGTANLMAAGRWWALAPAGHPYTRLARIQVESHFWATIVPGGVAADGYRILALGRRGTDPHRAAASIVIERAAGMLALLVLCGPALAFGAHWLSGKLLISLSALAGGLALILVGATAAALWSPVERGRLAWLPAKVRSACGGLERAFGEYRARRRCLARALGFALAYHAAFLALYALAGWALGIDLALGRWAIAVPLATLAATLPVNAWGIGLREGALVLVLVALGVKPGQAAAVSIVVVGLQMAVGSAGGISQLLRRRRVPATTG